MPFGRSRWCRRDFISWSVAGFAAHATMRTDPAAADSVRAAGANRNAGIFVFLNGGPSHIDMWDLKPEAPQEYRGPFRAISTKVPGLQVCEHLPQLARCADQFALLRSVSHNFGAHELGTKYICSGTRPVASLAYPEYGAVVAKELGQPADVPSYVAVPSSPSGTGFLGAAYRPFTTGNLPGNHRPIDLRGIALPQRLTLNELDRRFELLNQLDRQFDELEGKHELLNALDGFNAGAYRMMRSPATRTAFDLSRESPQVIERFGKTPFGQACLLAVRLVEAGVRFVSLQLSGWDTHGNNFPSLQNNLLPTLDVGLASLFETLTERGLMPTTSVLVTGEFGRTPKINDNAAGPGRDHHPQCMSVLMAGGRIQGGQVIGKSDKTASAPDGHAYSPDDVAATFYANLGIDPNIEYAVGGRPIRLVRDGSPISELLG